MLRARTRWAGGMLVLAAISGCSGSARMIASDSNGGIVAIPKNSKSWHRRAEQMMQERCPEGYEILAEEEVPVSQPPGQPRAQSSPGCYVPNTSQLSPSEPTEYRIYYHRK
jgi:hypothetical protein